MEIIIRNYVIIIVLSLSLSSCKNERNADKNIERTEITSSDLQVDHLNIWVKNPKKTKALLNEIGFTSIPDSLSQIHTGQGTTGRYFYFLNGYLELIFVYDQNELELNIEKNKDLDFIERANFEKNGASPFSIALNIKDYNLAKIPFEKISYRQDWMEENAYIYSAKNSKTNLKEPSIFVVYPEIESERFKTLTDLERIPDEYAFAREFYKHPNGAKRITNISIISPDLNLKTETIQAINGIENITVKSGKEHLMELFFDHKTQGKTIDLRPELPLIVYL